MSGVIHCKEIANMDLWQPQLIDRRVGRKMIQQLGLQQLGAGQGVGHCIMGRVKG